MDIPTVIEEFEKLRRTVPIGEDTEFVAAIASHLGFATESTVLIGQLPEETQRHIHGIYLLKPEQKERAERQICAMSEKFDVDEKDFSVLQSHTVTKGWQLTVAYTAMNGMYKGSWNQIMNGDSADDFIIEIDGQKIDTRTGMTLEVYEAMVELAYVKGTVLPDVSDGHPFSPYTLRTGDKINRDCLAPRAGVRQDGSVYCDGVPLNSNLKCGGFRPAIPFN